jgi:hypothetical protein
MVTLCVKHERWVIPDGDGTFPRRNTPFPPIGPRACKWPPLERIRDMNIAVQSLVQLVLGWLVTLVARVVAVELLALLVRAWDRP